MSGNREVVQRDMDRPTPRMRADRRAAHVRAGGALDAVRRGLCLVLCAAGVGCSDSPSSPAQASPPIDRLFIFARNWPTDYVEVALIRSAGGSTTTLFRPYAPGRPRIVLDSIGPGPEEPEEIRTILDSFDVWAMTAPDAPDGACRTVNGERNCAITVEDYSVVLRVEGGGRAWAQRYTGLEKSTGNAAARALGDLVLAWGRRHGNEPIGDGAQVQGSLRMARPFGP